LFFGALVQRASRIGRLALVGLIGLATVATPASIAAAALAQSIGKADGRIVFLVRGRRADFPNTMARRVQITVRMGDHCAQTTTALRPTKSGLTLP
jgi:hypothetical protein